MTAPDLTDTGVPRLEPIGFEGRVIIHIGPHKTGTTSLQHFLKDHYDSLLDLGVLYPRAGRLHGGKEMHFHHPLLRGFMGEAGYDLESQCKELREEISRTAPGVVILSSEILARENLPPSVVTRLRDLFPAARREWVLYLRRQDELLRSVYAELIKRGTVAWPDGIEKANTPGRLDHAKRIFDLRKIVGDDPIIPISFDAHKRDLIGSFFARCGLPAPGVPSSAYRRNESLPWGALHLMRIANRLPAPAKARVRRNVQRIAGTRMRMLLDWGRPLSDAEGAELLARYAESNRQVEAMLPENERVLSASANRGGALNAP